MNKHTSFTNSQGLSVLALLLLSLFVTVTVTMQEKTQASLWDWLFMWSSPQNQNLDSQAGNDPSHADELPSHKVEASAGYNAMGAAAYDGSTDAYDLCTDACAAVYDDASVQCLDISDPNEFTACVKAADAAKFVCYKDCWDNVPHK